MSWQQPEPKWLGSEELCVVGGGQGHSVLRNAGTRLGNRRSRNGFNYHNNACVTGRATVGEALPVHVSAIAGAKVAGVTGAVGGWQGHSGLRYNNTCLGNRRSQNG